MNWEIGFLMFLQAHQSSFMNSCMIFFTHLGNYGLIWISIGILLCIRPKYRRYGIALLIAIGSTALIGNFIIKPIAMRPRPCTDFPDIPLLISRPTSYSFPSSHSATSFAAVVVLWKLNKHFGLLAGIVAVLIAFSRMYLFVHYPTDILGGFLLGFFCALLTLHFLKLSPKNSFLKK